MTTKINKSQIDDTIIKVSNIDPTASDDASLGFDVGSQFFNETSKVMYICTDASIGAAVWEIISSTGSDNYTVKATTADTTPSFLDDKISLVSTDGSVSITKTLNNPSGNEDIEYDLSIIGGIGSGSGTKLAIDTTQVANNTGSPVTAFTIPIPGGTLGTSDAIRFRILVHSSGSSSDVEVEYGGQSLGVSNMNTGYYNIEGVIIADGATNAQKTQMNRTNQSQYETLNGSLTVDSTTSQNLDVIITNIGGGITVTAEAIIVEKISSGNGTIISLTAGEDLTAGDTVGYATVVDDTAMKAVFSERISSSGNITLSPSDIFSICEIDTDKFIIAYRDNTPSSGAYRTIVGLFDRDTMSWTFGDRSASLGIIVSGNVSVVKLDTDKFAVVRFSDIVPAILRTVIGTVSGTTISYGSDYDYAMGINANYISLARLRTDAFALVASGGTSGDCSLFEVTVSGTVATYGSIQTLSGTGNTLGLVTEVDTDKIAVMHATSIWIATVSGGTWTIGTPGVIVSTSSDQDKGGIKCIDPTGVFTLTGNGNLEYFTISGTSLTSVATRTTSITAQYLTLATDGTDMYLVANGTTDGNAKLSVVGADITLSVYGYFTLNNKPSTEAIFAQNIFEGTGYFGTIQNDDEGLSATTYSMRFNVLGMTRYFVGIVQNTVSRGGTAQVLISGVDENQTGLTAGAFYNASEGGIVNTSSQSFNTMQAQSATKLKI